MRVRSRFLAFYYLLLIHAKSGHQRSYQYIITGTNDATDIKFMDSQLDVLSDLSLGILQELREERSRKITLAE